MSHKDQLVEFTSDGVAKCQPSQAARAFYTASYKLGRPLLQRMVLGSKRPVGEQLVVLGRRINLIARLQEQ